MTDTMTRRQRSDRMALVRSKNTGPEKIVRHLVDRMKFKYYLHDPKLPGKPDFVFTRQHKAIFVHGCFWHRHKGCKLARIPKSRVRFWTEKLEGNRKRDARNLAKIRRLGWVSMIIWECQLTKPELLSWKIKRFLTTGGGKT